jgi:hypothetical protein
MDERERTISSMATFRIWPSSKPNGRARKALTDDVQDAIHRRSGQLGRALITERTGLSIGDLSPAEEKIVEVVSTYVGVMKRQGKDATQTLGQLSPATSLR